MGLKSFVNKSLGKIGLSLKSNSYNARTTNQTILDILRLGSHSYVSSQQAYDIYNFNSAVSEAVDSISSKVSKLTPIIKNDSGEISLKHDVLSFLKKPNNMESYRLFMEGVSTNYLINKNAYIEIIGNVDSKPSEIYNLANTWVSINESPGIASYIVNVSGFYGFLSGDFLLTSETGRIVGNSNLSEIVHVKGFSLSRNSLESVSILSSIERDIKMINQSNNHNLTLLEKGFNSLGIISVDTDDDDSFEQFSKDVKDKKSGSGNAGNLFVAKGKDIKFDSFGQTNRDMEYTATKKMSQDTVYQRYEIPKPLVDGSAQTYDNYQTARGALYDEAVFDVADKVFHSLTMVFRDRGMISEDEYITYDTRAITALQMRKSEELKSMQSSHILSLNELRAIAGYESVDGGDIILSPANLLPIGEDLYVSDNLSKPSKEFVDIMMKNGSNESEIRELWLEYQTAFRKNKES